MVTSHRYYELFYTSQADVEEQKRKVEQEWLTSPPDPEDALEALRRFGEAKPDPKPDLPHRNPRRKLRDPAVIENPREVAKYSWLMSRLALRRHWNSDFINETILTRWNELKNDRAMSKGKAAKIIAPEVGQTVGTVRKKLQKF